MGSNATGLGPLSADQQERIARNKALALKRKAEREAAAAGGGNDGGSSAGIGEGIGSGYSCGMGADLIDSSLEKTLQNYFGYPKFRHEQREVCEAVLSGRDVSVFWATGSGKSLCYQVPALHTHKTVVVVSPLISLMNDQVTAINHKIDLKNRASTFGGRTLPPATFLGTAGNPQDEEPAVQGLFRLLYVTPEKMMVGGFLERLGGLARAGGIAAIAIDEAHCVSQWGPDFRPSYFELGKVRDALPSVPLMALTATAVPRVREDIQTVLKQRGAFISTTSFDRTNLRICVHRKTSLSQDLMGLVETLSSPSPGSTIVYVPTIAGTETVARFLRDKLPDVRVCFYHGSQDLSERDRVHTQFLSGEARVVVATQAFGMGIDKPDIRRVVHYGAPKTFEEYYQQIGRAGRDGAPAVCDMYCSEADFAKYDSEFYTGKLQETAKQAVKASTEALRAFANDPDRCRRLAILEFFGEAPAWGERCGTCDMCLRHKSGDAAKKRDFRAEAAVLLGAVQACGPSKPPSMTKLLNVIGAPKADISGIYIDAQTRQQLQEMRKVLPRATRGDEMLKEVVVSLNSAGLLSRKSASANVAGMQRTWEVHELTEKGKKWLGVPEPSRDPIVLPMPQSMINAERAAKEQMEKTMAELVRAGVCVDQVPAEEIEEGAGEVMTVLTMWVRTLQRLRSSESSSQASLQRADHLEAVLKEVQSWRDEKARQLKMAPVAVLPDHLAMKIIHARATDTDAIIAAGVRIKGVEELAALMSSHFPAPSAVSARGASSTQGAAESEGQLLLPSGAFTAPKAWSHAVYKVAKNGALPKWEISYKRFSAGEHPQAIAMDQESGKPIQTNTVVSHILDALLHARSVDLHRLVKAAGVSLPTEREWNSIEDAVQGLNLDVVKMAMVSSKDILLAAAGRIDKPVDQKTAEDKEIETAWYEKIKWYLAFKRAGVPVSFTNTSGPQSDPHFSSDVTPSAKRHRS